MTRPRALLPALALGTLGLLGPRSVVGAPPPPAVEPEPSSTPDPSAPQDRTASEEIHAPFDIGLFPTFSTNARYRGAKIHNHVSVALLWNRSHGLDGITHALGVTTVDARGRGLALAGIGNLAHGEFQGVQHAWAFNFANRLRGLQVAQVNVGREVVGVQAGLVNVAGRVRGVQLGLVNVAESADASIALLPITKEGGIRAELWTSDTALLNAGFRLPARYTYAFASIGLHPFGRGSAEEERRRRGQGWEVGFGYGGHIPLPHALFLDLDFAGYAVFEGLAENPRVAPMIRGRALLGWQARPHVALWAGPTLTGLFDDPDRGISRPGYGWVTGRYEDADLRVRVWPGFAAGLRF